MAATKVEQFKQLDLLNNEEYLLVLSSTEVEVQAVRKWTKTLPSGRRYETYFLVRVFVKEILIYESPRELLTSVSGCSTLASKLYKACVELLQEKPDSNLLKLQQ